METLKKLVTFFYEIFCLIITAFAVVLGKKYRRRFNYNGRAFFDIVVACVTLIFLWIISKGTIVKGGFLYFLFSIEKRLGIAWASEGDWSHIMSGGRYIISRDLKNSLIQSNSFARFLNSLVINDGIKKDLVQGVLIILDKKILQIILLLACATVVVALLVIILYSIYDLFRNLFLMTRKALRKRSRSYRR